MMIAFTLRVRGGVGQWCLAAPAMVPRRVLRFARPAAGLCGFVPDGPGTTNSRCTAIVRVSRVLGHPVPRILPRPCRGAHHTPAEARAAAQGGGDADEVRGCQ